MFLGSLTKFWDWVDNRDIDKHAVSLVILYGTWTITRWAMAFASACTLAKVPGLETAAVIGAVVGPYSVMQGYALKVYFDARKST